MAPGRANVPFRWDVTRREQLGRLAEAPLPELYPAFLEDLLACASQVVASSDDADLVFVGRSPECVFDHLSGLLADTSWADRSVLLNISMAHAQEMRGEPPPHVVASLLAQFEAARLTPPSVAARERPVALVDVVARGRTFGVLAELLVEWARESGTDPAAVRRRLRFVGITWRKKTSPNTWRWQQRAPWARAFRPGQLRGISVAWPLFDCLANSVVKTSPSYPPWRWGQEWITRPSCWRGRSSALRLAHELYVLGTRREWRQTFARFLAREPAMRHAWLRRPVGELRRGRPAGDGGPRAGDGAR